jgi:hypothetical protein
MSQIEVLYLYLIVCERVSLIDLFWLSLYLGRIPVSWKATW